jgi:hypothetical protein
MRGTKCLKPLEVSRLFSLFRQNTTQLTRRRIATELHPVLLVVSPMYIFLVRQQPLQCLLRAVRAYICLSDTPVAGKFA